MGENPFRTLPDYLQPGLDIVFIGINPGTYSVDHGHYFARSTNRFWPAFSASKLSASARQMLGTDILRPEHDAELPRAGLGLTDIVKRPTGNAKELTIADFEKWTPSLIQKLRRYSPLLACFHGITGYRWFLKVAQKKARRPFLGPQPEVLGSTRLYVVPNPSPANAHFQLADQTAWYDRLANFLEIVKAGS